MNAHSPQQRYDGRRWVAVNRTPGPWHVEPQGCDTSHGLPIICKANGHLLAQLADRNIANAQFIVEACNAYDTLRAQNAELVKALEFAEQELTALAWRISETGEWPRHALLQPDTQQAIEAARAALAKVQKEAQL